MNLLLALVVTAAVLYQGAESPTYEQEPVIVGAVIKDSPAARAGLQIGDRIVTVAGREMRTWDQFFIEIGSRADRETEIVVDRGGRRETITVTPEPKKLRGRRNGVLPKTRLQLGGGHAAHGRGSCRSAARRRDCGPRRQVGSRTTGAHRPHQVESEQAAAILDCARWSADGRHRDAGGRSRIGAHRHPHQPLRIPNYPAGVPGSASAQPRQELGMDKAHLPDACRPVYARDVGAAVDGTRRDCRTIRRRGAAAGRISSTSWR